MTVRSFVRKTVSDDSYKNEASQKVMKTKQKTAETNVSAVNCGGGGRIRTIEAKRSRFTVCPLWPLGNSPILSLAQMEPVDGLEPPTY